MADPHANMNKTAPQEVLISVVAGLLAPLLAIFLVTQLILSIQEKHIPDTSAAANNEVIERIRPVAHFDAVDANAPKVEKSGEEVFKAACTACHTAGALGAPKFNNKGDWAGRLAQGYDKLVANAISGKNQMPARGGNPDLSDVEIARAVAYMTNSAGANFKAPAADSGAGKAPDAVAAPRPPEGRASGGVPLAGAAEGSLRSSGAPAGVLLAGAPASTEKTAPVQAAAAKTAAGARGEGLYKQTCAVCHAAGVAGAPKLGDKAAWGPRIVKGKDALYASGLKGLNAMPAKGGNPSLADADVKAAIDYMVSQAK